MEGDLQRAFAAGADDLLIAAQHLFSSGQEVAAEVAEIRRLVPDTDEARRTALQLVELEYDLYFGQVQETTFKTLAFLSPSSGTSTNCTALMRLKYQDLLTDYQFLLASHTKYLRLMDLVAKKINALTLVRDTNAVVRNVQLKVLVYYLLGDSDFRNKSVLRYLVQEQIMQRYENSAIAEFMSYKERLIPYATFGGLLHYMQHFYSFRRVLGIFRTQLTENFLDTNMSKLPRYYRSIRRQRITSLLMPDADIDVESVISRMIINNKLPAGTTIDQIRGIVYFGDEESKYDDFNLHVKKICDLVEVLGSGNKSTN